MLRTPHRLRHAPLALVAAAAVTLGACSKSDVDAPTPTAQNATPTQMAAAPTAAAVTPTAPPQVAATPAPAPAPVVVAQNNTYEQGRRDQQRADAQRVARERERDRALREPPPRADRDADVDRRAQRVAAAVCHECGVVEAVNAVEVQGQNKGVGAVAGGVGGALVGNRIAGDHNRTLGGVVGAVGGGLIGNAIEKHQRKSTAYDVTVRMDDGTRRTVRESTAPAVGEKVRVESDGLHERG